MVVKLQGNRAKDQILNFLNPAKTLHISDELDFFYNEFLLSEAQGTSEHPYGCFKIIRDFLNKIRRSGTQCGVHHNFCQRILLLYLSFQKCSSYFSMFSILCIMRQRSSFNIETILLLCQHIFGLFLTHSPTLRQRKQY